MEDKSFAEAKYTNYPQFKLPNDIKAQKMVFSSGFELALTLT
jgi:hypothetical protein